LLLFLVIVCQLSDVLQYVYGKWLGRRKIAPTVSPNKTWEGLLALMITLLGFAGGLVMSSNKRDRGVKDFGNLIQGHGGILDRMDSVIFAAPVFFHVVRFFYGL
jgi:phosphatidate cytidylyltransferase